MSNQVLPGELTEGILSFLPLFYVGWSDSVLSPSEMKIIHEKLNCLECLTAEEKAYLIKWTDPTSPPDESTFKEWVIALKSYGKDLAVDGKTSLVDLGLEIAKGSQSGKDLEETKSALIELGKALGVDGQISSNILLSKIDSANEIKPDGATFDVKALQDFMDGEYADTKNRMRILLSDHAFAYVTEPDKDIFRLRILDQTKELAKQGVSAYSFPKKYGGGERSGDHIAVFEMLGYSDLSLAIKFGVQFGLFGGALYSLGTEKHHKKYLEAMHRADLLGCFAMTETGHGSNVNGLTTTATYDSDTKELVIHSPNVEAGKEYIGNAMHSTMAAVFAQLIVDGESHGVHAVLVPIRDDNNELMPGVTVKDSGYKMGLNGVDNGRIWFDNVRVPKDNLLNRFGDIDDNGHYDSPLKNPSKRFFTMLGALVVGRICVGLAGISASKSALTIATKYALKRRQFNAKDNLPETLIMDYPTHQHRLIPLVAKTYAYYFALRRLADKYTNNTDGDMRHIETLAAGLKSKATWHATRTIQECREACGGKGYLKENRFADLKADTDIFTTFEGDNTVLMQLVAKGVLTEFRKSFGENNFFAVMKYLQERLSKKLIEINPSYANNTSVSHLLDPRFHAHAFRYREEKLTLSVSTRMRKYLGQRIDPNDAYMRCQLHMLELGAAYSERLALTSFQSAIETVEDKNVKSALEKVCQLYALTIIQQEKGFFLENEYLGVSKTKAIRRMIAKLNQELRPMAGTLVDSFGIPEELLGANIILYN